MHTEKTTTGSSAKRKTSQHNVRGLLKIVVVLGVTIVGLAALATMMENLLKERADLQDKVRALSDARGDGRTVYNYVCDDGVRKSFKWKEFVDPLSGDRSVVYMGPCKGVSFDYGTGD